MDHRRITLGITSVALVIGLLLTLALALVLWPAVPARAQSAPSDAPGTSAAATPATSPQAPVDLTAEDVSAWLDGYLPARLETAGIVGGAVSVVADGRVLTTRGYGTTSVGGAPVDPDRTLFRVASVTKLVTATAAMQLVQDGRLDLDTDIDTYLDVPMPRRFDQPITLRHLLSHTAGFEERYLPDIADTPDDLPTLHDVVTVDPPEQIFEPGTTPAYSNYGLAVVGHIVEEVSGQSYDDYVAENVLGPLGMTNSTTVQPLPAALADQMAAGYSDGGQTEVPFELIPDSPAGALSATAADMARFMLAHLQGGTYGGGVILDEATTDLMQTPALGEAELGTLAGGERMTLGFFTEDRNGRASLGHGGDTFAFHSHLQIYPEEGAGIFVTYNSTGTDAVATDVLRDQLVDGFADRYFGDGGVDHQRGGDREAPLPTLDTSAAHALAAEGSYLISRRSSSTFLRVLDLMPVTVTAGPEGTIEMSILTVADGTPKRWREVEPWVWQEVGGEDRIAMRVEDGRVATIGAVSAFALTRAPTASALAVPVLIGGAAVLLLTVMAWPAIALVRRHYGRRLQLTSTARRARVGTRIGALLVLITLAAWAGVLLYMSTTFAPPPLAALRVLQVLTAVGFGVLVGTSAWQVWTTWRTPTPWTRRIWAVLLLVAGVAVSWVAITYGLFEPSLTF